MNRYLNKRGIRIVGLLVVLIFVSLFVFRGAIIRSYADRKIASALQHYGIKIHYDQLTSYGLTGIELRGLSIVPVNRDTLFYVGELKLSFNPWKLLLLKPDVRKLEMDAARLDFIKIDSINSNFDFLYRLRSEKNKGTEIASRRDYAHKIDRLSHILFDLMPKSALLHDIKVKYLNQGDFLTVNIPSLEVKDHLFQTSIESVENGDTCRLVFSGKLYNEERRIGAKVHSADIGKMKMPFLEYRCGLSLAFDTLTFELAADKMRSEQVALNGEASVSGLSLHHNRISPDDVVLDKGKINYTINVGKNFVELDSTTNVSFNKLDFNPYMRIERNDDWRFIASVNKQNFAADDLFTSLPKGLFYNLEGIRTRGKLSYSFLFDVDFAHLNDLRFNSQMRSQGFAIESFGNTNLRKMNAEFLHTVYEKDVAVRTFSVGESNPEYCPLASISPLLQMSVLQSEDGEFFYHNGFMLESIREAIIKDIRVRKFVRGGSTISMQLVKNVFLNRNKTIARKLEEAIIVWLIESNRLTSKERMFEVYLNIAEWGPGIYGVGEAARFYFDKEPSQLNVEEAIFMTELIPHPKRSLAAFNDSLQLKPYYANYFRRLASRLQIKGAITPEQAALIRPEVTLSGNARKILQRQIEERTMKVDTISVSTPLVTVP